MLYVKGNYKILSSLSSSSVTITTTTTNISSSRIKLMERIVVFTISSFSTTHYYLSLASLSSHTFLLRVVRILFDLLFVKPSGFISVFILAKFCDATLPYQLLYSFNNSIPILLETSGCTFYIIRSLSSALTFSPTYNIGISQVLCC